MLIKLGDVIKSYRKKCGIPNLTVNDIDGIDINKRFFSPTKQVGKNTSNYLVVPPNYFACNLMHVGRDGSIPLAMNDTNQEKIVSGAYFVFKNIREDIILNQFLFISLSRPEFDRLATFNTDSSVRDGLTWDRFSEIKIEIPSLEIQQKYVDVYNALVANQKAYENGLDDLKLVYENQFEEAQKKYKKDSLINHITERREINTNGKFTNLRGISQNGLIPPNQKRSKESMKKTKIFYLNDIIYAPSSLKNGAVVLNNEYHQALCSEEYIVFRVKEDLLPEYVFILLKRKELGRYIDFLSVDSVRNRFYFADLEILDIALVPLDLQQSIVDIYKLYETRKEINEKLKQQIKEICPVLIKGAIQESKGVI